MEEKPVLGCQVGVTFVNVKLGHPVNLRVKEGAVLQFFTGPRHILYECTKFYKFMNLQMFFFFNWISR